MGRFAWMESKRRSSATWICAILTAVAVFGLRGLPAQEAAGNASDGPIPPDRRIPWNPGIAGGIPSYPVGVNVKDAAYGAKGDGQTDDSAAIQKAIEACPAGKAVLLPAGTYKVIATLDIVKKGIVLRGEGPGKTFLKSHATNETAPPKAKMSVIHVRGEKGSVEANVTGGATKDSTSLTVDDASKFEAGDCILLDQENDPAVVRCPHDYQKRAIGQVVLVAKKAGNALTINRPLYYAYNPAMGIKITKMEPVKGAGIEDLHVERAVSAGFDNIGISYGANCWLRNVESRMARKWHVRLKQCYATEVRECYVHEGHAAGGDCDYGIGFIQKSTDCLVENNVMWRCRHAMIFEYGGCGNVYGYNCSKEPINEGQEKTDWLMSDISLHGGHPYMNLFEGNVGAHIDCDNVLGSSRHNTFFRNRIEAKSIPAVKWGMWAVEVQACNLYTNVVGNVLGTEGVKSDGIWRIGYNQLQKEIDPKVEETLLRHGNHDAVGKQTAWDPKIADRNLPPSYYLKSKPAFFGDLAWPPFGPDLKEMVGKLPAEVRFEALQRK